MITSVWNVSDVQTFDFLPGFIWITVGVQKKSDHAIFHTNIKDSTGVCVSVVSSSSLSCWPSEFAPLRTMQQYEQSNSVQLQPDCSTGVSNMLVFLVTVWCRVDEFHPPPACRTPHLTSCWAPWWQLCSQMLDCQLTSWETSVWVRLHFHFFFHFITLMQ